MLLKYSYKRCSLFREDRYKEDLWRDIYQRSTFIFLWSPAHCGERPAQGLWAMTELDMKALCGHSDRWLGGEALLTCPENFSKRISGGYRIFKLLSRQHPYWQYALSTGDWLGKQTSLPMSDVNLWARLLLFQIKTIPAVANREDPSPCKSSNMVCIT